MTRTRIIILLVVALIFLIGGWQSFTQEMGLVRIVALATLTIFFTGLVFIITNTITERWFIAWVILGIIGGMLYFTLACPNGALWIGKIPMCK